jgi:hypothetical protein
MSPADHRRERGVLFAVPALIVLLGCGWRLVPFDVVVWLIAWTFLSLPLAILIGHCALTED